MRHFKVNLILALFLLPLFLVNFSCQNRKINEEHIPKNWSINHENMKPPLVHKSEEEWKKELSDLAYTVLRESGTERPFTGKYDKHFEQGTYACHACKFPLFDSEKKYNSGCGWPAFWAELETANILQKEDLKFGMKRIELLCSNCGSHLGHIFNDGPPPTGKRYCINSVCLDFIPKEQ